MKVNWINGEINPPSCGEYYAIIEAQCDFTGVKKGDIEIHTDYFDGEMWQEIGKDNPYWKVLFWASVPHPDIPADIRDRVKIYF